MNTDPIYLIERVGLKPTSNRLIILRTLLRSNSPLSLIEIESLTGSLERSSILRVLNLFHKYDIVHNLEDGRGITKYEVCHGEHCCSVDDMHPHFYCEVCNKVYCFENLHVPDIDIPETFKVKSVNFMLKGICPNCNKKVP